MGEAMNPEPKNQAFCNRVGDERIASRQIDELIGLARGIAADGSVNQREAEFLQKWLAANAEIANEPIIRTLYHRINEVLSDGILDDEEALDLLSTLNAFARRDFELGEMMKPTSLPLCDPAPELSFAGRSYCFTGTFVFGKRPNCEQAVVDRGGVCGNLTMKTDVLVIGAYATESWKYSSYGNKIEKACNWRDAGKPICIVSENHWTLHL